MLSPSHLFFTNQAGDRVWQLPYDMTPEVAKPQLVAPRVKFSGAAP